MSSTFPSKRVLFREINKPLSLNVHSDLTEVAVEQKTSLEIRLSSGKMSLLDL